MTDTIAQDDLDWALSNPQGMTVKGPDFQSFVVRTLSDMIQNITREQKESAHLLATLPLIEQEANNAAIEVRWDKVDRKPIAGNFIEGALLALFGRQASVRDIEESQGVIQDHIQYAAYTQKFLKEISDEAQVARARPLWLERSKKEMSTLRDSVNTHGLSALKPYPRLVRDLRDDFEATLGGEKTFLNVFHYRPSRDEMIPALKYRHLGTGHDGRHVPPRIATIMKPPV